MREANDELAFAWRGPLDDDEMLDLVASHGGRPERGWWDKVRPHSLGWVTARTADGTLVGFVNVAWDGSDHAILIDTKTGGPFQRRGVGTRLVQVAAEQARAAGCEWLHVDFEAHLQSFYFDACGFTRTDAGVIHLAVGLGCARLGQRCGMSLDRTAGGHVPGSRTQAGQLVVRYPRRAWTIRGRAGDHRFLGATRWLRRD